MNIAQTAQRIGISRSKLYRLAETGRISYYRVGRSLIFHEDDIAAFLAGCRVAATLSRPIDPTPRLKLKHINLSRGS